MTDAARQAMRFAFVAMAGAAASLFLPPCGQAQEVAIKVLVNDDPISDYDISQRERFLVLTTKAEPSPALKKKSTDMLIDERLQLQEGRKIGATPDAEKVNKILGDMASKNNLDVNGLSGALGRAGVNVKTLKDRIGAQLVWQSVVRQKFRREVQIGDLDVDRALAASGEDAAQSSVRVQQIRLELPSGADPRTVAAKLAEAENLRARFSGCSSITNLASGVSGASVKSLQEQQAIVLPQPARLLVKNAKAGQMTPPTISRSAIELYAVCGSRAVTSDGNVRETAQRKLMNDEMLIRAEGLLRDLRQDAFIEYR